MFPCKLCSSECEKFYVVCASCYAHLQAENKRLNRELISTKSELLLTKRMYNAGFETYKELQAENEKLRKQVSCKHIFTQPMLGCYGECIICGVDEMKVPVCVREAPKGLGEKCSGT